jgi:poly(A) polymerase
MRLGKLEKFDKNNPDHMDPEKYKIYLGDVLEHTIRVMEYLKNESLEVQFAGMFHDIGKPETKGVTGGRITNREHARIGAKKTREILEALKFSKKFIEYVGELVYDHMKMLHVKGMRKAKQKRFFAQDNFSDLRDLHIADEKGGFNDLSIIEYIDNLKIEYEKESLRPEPFLDGRDLINLGFVQGVLIGSTKKEIYNQQLDGTITTKDDAVLIAKKVLERLG